MHAYAPNSRYKTEPRACPSSTKPASSSVCPPTFGHLLINLLNRQAASGKLSTEAPIPIPIDRNAPKPKAMASSTARMARAVLLVAAVVLMQCCNVIVAARLLEGDGGWLRLRQGAGSLIMQVLPRGTPAAGSGNPTSQNPNHPRP
ncbi:hypothetical protein D1007_38403 [Hordeum vulgare]|nr:hypothetical protein D1007_38403 [Hordeum vulgare]